MAIRTVGRVRDCRGSSRDSARSRRSWIQLADRQRPMELGAQRKSARPYAIGRTTSGPYETVVLLNRLRSESKLPRFWLPEILSRCPPCAPVWHNRISPRNGFGAAGKVAYAEEFGCITLAPFTPGKRAFAKIRLSYDISCLPVWPVYRIVFQG